MEYTHYCAVFLFCGFVGLDITSAVPNEAERHIYMVELAGVVERYDDMADEMAAYVKLNIQLTIEQQTMLSTAFTNKVGARRASWRLIDALYWKEVAKENFAHIAKSYREKIEGEITDICNSMFGLIDNHLLVSADDIRSRVLYLKLKGVFQYYLVEISTGDAKQKYIDAAKVSYEVAIKLAKDMKATDPLRLGLILNAAVFYYEIGQKQKAIDMAKTAFDKALPALKALTEEEYKDTTLRLLLLSDNITLWTGAL